MKRRFSAFLCVILLAGVACDGDAPDPQARPTHAPIPEPRSTSTRVIGLVGTMRGPDAARGEDAFEGADLAVNAMNRAEAAFSFELVTRDDQGSVERALEAIEELAASPQTVGIVYAGPPEAIARIQSAVEGTSIPVMLISGDPYSAQALSANLFQMSPPMLWQARRLTDYIRNDRRYDRIAVLAERSPEGRTAVSAIDTAFEDVSGPRVERLLFAYASPEFEQFMDQLRAARAEAIVFQGSTAALNDLLSELDDAGARYRGTSQARIDSAPAKLRKRRIREEHWRPQVLTFDPAIAPAVEGLHEGVVAADSYARGTHYLPLPGATRFRRWFLDWWDQLPLGWEQRAFDAARAIGWAAARGPEVARELEQMNGQRFAGLDITFGPDDHTAVEQTSIGLWVVPRPGAAPESDELPTSLPWVPLARGFSIDGERTVVQSEDWRWLFRDPPPKRAPAPRFGRMRFGVTSPRSDPVH